MTIRDSKPHTWTTARKNKKQRSMRDPAKKKREMDLELGLEYMKKF